MSDADEEKCHEEADNPEKGPETLRRDTAHQVQQQGIVNILLEPERERGTVRSALRMFHEVSTHKNRSGFALSACSKCKDVTCGEPDSIASL